MVLPFLRLVCTRSAGTKGLQVIIAASGPHLYTFNASDGSFLSQWSYFGPPPTSEQGSAEHESEPPAKRRRLSMGEDEVSDAQSAEIITNNSEAGKPRRRRAKAAPVPSVVKLCTTSTGQYLIAVTGEDKTVRVLEMMDGQLSQISERQMPKKPSAVAITPDGQTILVADKFGDVYAMPLLSPESPQNVDHIKQPVEEAEPYKPSATILTVHSQKNRRTLENQLKAKHRVQKKKTVEFEHRLLLGHVSMLTDMLYVDHQAGGKSRSYLLTADRDEHIRVSRGMPQTHVIEGFCLGHANYVSRLNIPSAKPDLLISGGGDDSLFVWNWLQARIIAQTSLLENVRAVWEDSSKATTGEQGCGSETRKIAVSGLWSMQLPPHLDDIISTDVFVICEAVPALFIFRLNKSGQLSHRQTMKLEYNPLDLAFDTNQALVIVSLDTIHEPGSTNKASSISGRNYVRTFHYVPADDSWSDCDRQNGLERRMNNWAETHTEADAVFDLGVLGDLFYGLEHLRKKAGVEPEQSE